MAKIILSLVLAAPLLLSSAAALAQVTPANPAVTMPDPNVGAQPVPGQWNPAKGSLPAEGLIAIPIPNVKLTDYFFKETDTTKSINVPWIAQYISGAYKFAIAIAGVIAATMMIIGGFLYLTAGGDAGRLASGKEKISDAVLGLVLVLGTYMVLNVINPSLVALEGLNIETVKKLTFVPNETPAWDIPEPGTPGTTGTANVPYLGQYNYKNIPYINSTPETPCPTNPSTGSTYSVASSGCGISSASMIIAKYKGESNAEPILREMVQLVKDTPTGRSCSNGCKDCNGTNFGGQLGPAIKSKYGLKVSFPGTSQAKIMELLRAGKPVIGNFRTGLFTSGGHYVVLTGINADGTISVNDPGRNPASPYTCYPRAKGCTPNVNINQSSVPANYIFDGSMRSAVLIAPE